MRIENRGWDWLACLSLKLDGEAVKAQWDSTDLGNCISFRRWGRMLCQEVVLKNGIQVGFRSYLWR